jgi:hypothetical protein
MMEAVRASEPSVYFNETTRRYIPEGRNVHVPFRFAANHKIQKCFASYIDVISLQQTTEIPARAESERDLTLGTV